MKPAAVVPPQRRASGGFTLVEVLVALLAMALLAGLAWRGLDGVLRSRDAGRESIDRTVRLATVLTQWEQDLQALHDSGAVPPLSFDGQSLRLTRRSERGVSLVSWSVRGGVWQRWSSPVLVNSGELQDWWLRSHQFVGNEAGSLTVADAASEWQVYFHRGTGWSNAQSSGDLLVPAPALPAAPAAVAPGAAGATGATGAAGAEPGPGPGPGPAPAAPAAAAPPQAREQLPNAVRLVITLGGNKLTRDVLLGPTGA
jgi:general secretion pathway protein J